MTTTVRPTAHVEILCACGARIRHCEACGRELRPATLLNGLEVDCDGCGGTRIAHCQQCGELHDKSPRTLVP